MLLYTAFILGLLGSFHCVGMCGPIAFALPISKRNNAELIKSRVLYNLGRILTYTLLGAIVGVLGRGVVLSGAQQWLSIGVGVLLLLFFILPNRLTRRLDMLRPVQKLVFRVKQNLGHLFKQKTAKSYVLIGTLNGFLPCGLVYLAMAGAIATGSVTQAMAYMALFGAGTFPVMLTVALAGNFIKPQLKTRMYKLVPVFTITLAVLLIVRGLNLGIPYLSPKIVKHHHHTSIECCEVPDTGKQQP
ncbi:sulfite exporter TauE/SafE family protein [Microscilla marina]|uniref:Membrane protein, putative n=1 Tax=Microscilla marina ATCC 23134 TaxID=313606 RepID=A1ZN72_MICM2|nr:sulfite exporter TauE/SafE family protein [Microscilla marina]EAY28253.1 membrane protein, putative [Microscilla marina ATCC 23134]